jgi:hypothetical protein
VGCKVDIDWRVIPIWLQAALTQTCVPDPRLSGVGTLLNIRHFNNSCQTDKVTVDRWWASSSPELGVKACHLVNQFQFFIRITHRMKLLGERKSPSVELKIEMVYTKQREHDRFVMSVHKNANVHL